MRQVNAKTYCILLHPLRPTYKKIWVLRKQSWKVFQNINASVIGCGSTGFKAAQKISNCRRNLLSIKCICFNCHFYFKIAKNSAKYSFLLQVGSFNYDMTKMVFIPEFVPDEKEAIKSILDYQITIKELRPEQTHYMALGMNYSVTGFEMILQRKMSFYIVTYYLPSGIPCSFT